MRGNPLVSCIMPTNRPLEFIHRAFACFEARTYLQAELVIVIDTTMRETLRDSTAPQNRETKNPECVIVQVVPAGASLGDMRNVACRAARGSIIVHWDSDDWHHPTRIEKSVEAIRNGAMLVGSSKTYCVKPSTKERWLYDGEEQPAEQVVRLYGATIAYSRAAWEWLNFSPFLNSGEDTKWIRGIRENYARAQVVDLADPDLVWAHVDDRNTCTKQTYPPLYSPVEWIDHPGVMK